MRWALREREALSAGHEPPKLLGHGPAVLCRSVHCGAGPWAEIACREGTGHVPGRTGRSRLSPPGSSAVWMCTSEFISYSDSHRGRKSGTFRIQQQGCGRARSPSELRGGRRPTPTPDAFGHREKLARRAVRRKSLLWWTRLPGLPGGGGRPPVSPRQAGLPTGASPLSST